MESLVGKIRFYPVSDREMPDGSRCRESRPLTPKEIRFLKEEIASIHADENVFVFNDPDHIVETGYDFLKNVIFVGRNVFPDVSRCSLHPRDQLTPKAMLALEYYGRRKYRGQYFKEDDWLSEAHASLDAAINAPNLDRFERATLIREAGRRAEEAGKTFRLDRSRPEIREILYGQWENKGAVVPIAGHVMFVDITG